MFFSDSENKLINVEDRFGVFKISTIRCGAKNKALVIYGTFSDGEKLIAQNFTRELFEELLQKEENLKITFGRMNQARIGMVIRALKETLEKV